MRSSTLQHPFWYQVTATQADDLPMMNNIRTSVGKPLATLEENDWILNTMCLLKRIWLANLISAQEVIHFDTLGTYIYPP